MKQLSIVFITLLGLTACTPASEKTEPVTENPPVETVAESKPGLSDLINLYDLQSGLFAEVLSGISDEEATQRMSENTNSVAWIAGHTVDIQYNIAMMLGIVQENPYAAQFGFGKPFDAAASYPTLEKMQSDWNALTPQIKEAMSKLTTERLESGLPFQIPFAEQNLNGFLAFQMHHLGYELGQLGLYRKFLGKEAMSYQ